MANLQITQLVDDLISKGRIQSSMRDNYINMLAASPELEQEFSSMLLRGGDYTKKTQALAEETRQAKQWFDEERQKLANDRQKLDGWYNNVQGELNEYERVKKEILPKMAAYEQTLNDYYIDDKPLLDRVSIPSRPTTPTAPQTSPQQTAPKAPGNYITRDDLQTVVNNYTTLNGK